MQLVCFSYPFMCRIPVHVQDCVLHCLNNGSSDNSFSQCLVAQNLVDKPFKISMLHLSSGYLSLIDPRILLSGKTTFIGFPPKRNLQLKGAVNRLACRV